MVASSKLRSAPEIMKAAVGHGPALPRLLQIGLSLAALGFALQAPSHLVNVLVRALSEA